MRGVNAALGTVLILGAGSGPIAFLTACHDPGHDLARAEAVPHEREYNFTLAPDGFGSVFGLKKDGSFTVRLPHLSVFDRADHLILDLKTYRTDLLKLLNEATRDPRPLDGGRTLTEGLSQVWTIARRPPVMSDLGDAAFFVFTYEAEWCVPCKAQLKDLRGFAETNPSIRINLVRVEVDTKVFDEGQ